MYIEFYKARTDLQRQKAGQLLPGDQRGVEEDTGEEAGSGDTDSVGAIAVLVLFIPTTMESQVCADAKS